MGKYRNNVTSIGGNVANTMTAAELRYLREVEREQHLMDWLDGHHIGDLNNFEGDFRVFRPIDRNEEIFRKEEGVLIPVLRKEIKAEMGRQIRASLPNRLSMFNMKYRELSDPLNLWVDSTMTKLLTEYPQPVGFKSSPWECFSRLNWDPIPCSLEEMEKECAVVIAPMRKRIITNRDALDLRMGSLADIESDRKQMVYLWGEYDGGKSFIMNEILFQLAGGVNGVIPMRPKQLNNDHFSHSFVRKGIIVIHECPPSFMTTEEFKMLTGENRIAVNPKNKDVFTTDLRCLIFGASNKPPEVPSDPALRRRIIDCEILNLAESEKKSSKVLKHHLEHELKFYMGYCIEKWNEFKASGKVQIPTGDSIQEHIDNYESGMDFIFHRHFQCVPGGRPTLTIGEVLAKVQMELQNAHISKEQFRDFISQKYQGHTKQSFWHKASQKSIKGVANIALK